jgi:hypothetical protein
MLDQSIPAEKLILVKIFTVVDVVHIVSEIKTTIQRAFSVKLKGTMRIICLKCGLLPAIFNISMQ